MRPLDYFAGQDREKGAQRPEHAPPPPPPPRPVAVAPVEFDTLLTQTADHAAAQAIRLALETLGIAVHQADDGSVTGGELRLLVRAADEEEAIPVATAVFARREKFHSFPRQSTGADPVPSPGNSGEG